MKNKYLTKEEIRNKINNKEYDDIIISFMPLVTHICKKYHLENNSYEDMFSIGVIGLIKGVKKISINEGNPITYLYTSIKNELIDVLQIEQRRIQYCSTDLDVSKYENQFKIIDFFKDENVSIDRNIINEDLKKVFNEALSHSSERGRYIIEHRYGLNDNIPCTQQILADRMGIKRSTLAMAEKKTLNELKQYIIKNNKEFIIQ